MNVTERQYLLSGATDVPVAPFKKDGCFMKQWISINRCLRIPTAFSARRLTRAGAALFASCFLSQAVWAADFTVTSPGFFYAINGAQPNPTITLVRGQTYTFAVNSSSVHPFQILSAGVLNNNISQGIITYTVPISASNYTYICSIHGFGGQIITVDPTPPPPPMIRLLSLTVSDNVVLRSTGTNGWSVHPEYSTDLTATNWFALSVLSNRFLNGTNETFCGRPPGSNVFLRVRSQPN